MGICTGITAIGAAPLLLPVILTIIYLVAFANLKAARLLNKTSASSEVSTNFVTLQNAFVSFCPRSSRSQSLAEPNKCAG